MKTNNVKMSVSLVALAVQAALLGMFANPVLADEAEVAALTKPSNAIEIGAVSVSSKSAKFGEYNGLNKSVIYGNLNFNVRGGDAYGDSQGTKRWSLLGTDLGLSSRSFSATVSDQGNWNVGINYDELTHNITDTYKTPFQGSSGGNNFTLPAVFGKSINTGLTGGTNNSTNIANIQAAWNQVDIASRRKNTSLSIGRNLDNQWDVKFDFNRLDQSGAKLMAYGVMGNSFAAANKTLAGEAISIMPNPTYYRTDTVNLALNYVGEKGHFSSSYFNSYFHDGYDGVNFQAFASSAALTSAQFQTMTTPPSNSFSQLNFNGGYDFTSKTKLTGGVSYGENTQNEAYVDNNVKYPMAVKAPESSLGGFVLSKHADVKLTNQATQNLIVTASFKYDERDDKTASNFYNFYALSGTTNHVANFPNAPISNKKTQSELAGDFRLTKDQRLRLAYNQENVNRWCNQYAVGGTGYTFNASASPTNTSPANGTNSYPNGTNCVVATQSGDEKLSATYKLKAKDSLNFNVGYSYSSRKTNSDPNAITDHIGLNGNPNLASAASATNVQIQGLNAGNFIGFYPAFNASRKEKMLKAGVNWEATEGLSLSASTKYTDDVYDSTYGVKNGNSWSANLDGTYAYSESGSISAYVTQQHRQRDLTDLQRSPTGAAATNNTASSTVLNQPQGATWTNTLQDNETTVGVAAKQGGNNGSKLELSEDLTYSLGKTGYDTKFNYASDSIPGATGLPVYTCASQQFLTCGALPNISSKMLQFRLVGKYAVSKRTKVSFAYQYRQLKSDDYYYNGLQIGSTPTGLLPTNQQAPTYSVNVFSLGYVYDF
jgi:MtrB/PioB family decaheme-associated outer membrane protein